MREYPTHPAVDKPNVGRCVVEDENGRGVVVFPGQSPPKPVEDAAVDSAYYRDKANRCRLMLEIAALPDIKEQLRIWEIEFDDLADRIERRKRRRRRMRAGWNRLRRTLSRVSG